MKILVSYISSRYDLSETIKKIDSSIADGIHVDLMDGIYVHQSNSLPNLENISKPIDIHLMVDNPNNYFAKLLKLNPVCIYIHPSTTNNFYDDYEYLKSNNIGLGVVINPNEDIAVFEKYRRFLCFDHVRRQAGFVQTTAHDVHLLQQKILVAFVNDDIIVRSILLCDVVQRIDLRQSAFEDLDLCRVRRIFPPCEFELDEKLLCHFVVIDRSIDFDNLHNSILA